jgi:hypothetical protein
MQRNSKECDCALVTELGLTLICDVQISEVLLYMCLCNYCTLCPWSEIQGCCVEVPGFSP